MKRFLWITSVMVVSAFCQAVVASECIATPQQAVKVEYENPQRAEQRLIFWRYQGEVAWENPTSGQVALWHRLPNGRVAMNKLFTKAKRGIAYEPADLHILGKDQDWRTLAVLGSPKMLGFGEDDLDRTGAWQQSPCLNIQTFLSADRGIALEWIPELAVPASLKVKGAGVNWKASRIVTEVSAVQKRFDEWRHYELTDFADIGDMEADPFVSQMINMGFVEHSEHSAYYANGQPID